MTRDAEAVAAVKEARRRVVGFDATPAAQKTRGVPLKVRRALEDAFAEGRRDLVAKLKAAQAASSADGSPREEMHRPGTEGGELRKSRWDHPSVDADRRAHDAGVRAGDAIVRAAQARRAVPSPTGAIADAERARARLADVAAATPDYRNDSRLSEAAQFAEALAAPVKKTLFTPAGRVEDRQLEERRAPLDDLAIAPGTNEALRTAPYVQQPAPQAAQPWQPHAGDRAACAGADALMGCSAEELASAMADAAQGAPGHLDLLNDRAVAAAIKRAPRLRGLATRPPRVTP